MNFQQFRQYKNLISELRSLSSFNDDGLFLVEIDLKDLAFKERVKAPSRIVLEHAVWRAFGSDIEPKQLKIRNLTVGS